MQSLAYAWRTRRPACSTEHGAVQLEVERCAQQQQEEGGREGGREGSSRGSRRRDAHTPRRLTVMPCLTSLCRSRCGNVVMGTCWQRAGVLAAGRHRHVQMESCTYFAYGNRRAQN